VDQPWAVPPDEDPHQGQPLRTRFGELHTYRIVPTRNPTTNEPSLDLGFSITCQVGNLGLTSVEPGQIVTVTQDPGGALTWNACVAR